MSNAMIFFRDQNLTEDDQRRFASYFGPVAKRVPPPKSSPKVETVAWDDMMMITDHVDANGKPVGSLGHGEMWFHSDKCYHRTSAPRDLPLRHRDPVRRRRYPVLQHVRRL